VTLTFKHRIVRDVVLNRVLSSALIPERLRFHLLRATGMRFADPVYIKPGCVFVSTDIEIGAHSGLEYDCRILNEATVTIGSYCGIGAHVIILTGSHELGNGYRRVGTPNPLPVVIGDGVWIGAGAMILPGVTIGDGCVIAAGAVVTASCAPHGIYLGNPAELIRQLKTPTGPRSTGPPDW
jgi:maltose O-acetyltransferase